MLGAYALVVAFVFVSFFATNVVTLLVGQILLGMPFGMFQALASTYASDVCPPQVRPYLTTYINLCWVIGQIMCSGVLRGVVNWNSEWAFRIPFAIQWFWPIPLGVLAFFAPESPWWLVRRGRLEDAKRSLLRLTNTEKHPDFDVDQAVAMILYTDNMEKSVSAGTSYLDCFKGSNLRRTEIVCFAWATQILSGSILGSYTAYFLEQAGMSDSLSFTLNIVTFVLGGIGTISSWFFMSKYGRRSMYLGGLGILFVILLVEGFLSLTGKKSGAEYAIGSLMVVWTFIYDCTIGPVCYSIIAEIPSSRLRLKSIVLARNTFTIVSIVALIITPLMLNPTAWNWGAKAAFFWAGSCFIALVWTFFRLPEPKGRSYAELDLLFENEVPARKFASTNTDGALFNQSEVKKVTSISEQRIERV